MNYTEAKKQLRAIGDSLAPILGRLAGEGLQSDFADWQTDLDTDVFTVVVVGEFNRGKSTLLNALFQQEILPVGATPTTAFVTMLRFSEINTILVHYVGGRMEEIDFSPDSLRTLISSPPSPANAINYVEVGIPHALLREGVVYVDTPGVADLNRDRMDVTYRFVPRADAVIFVLDSTQQVTRSEIDFLESTILNKGIERLLFVSNFADLLDHDEQREAAAKIQTRLAGAMDKDDFPVVVLSAKYGCSEDGRNLSGLVELETELQSISLDGARSHEKVAHLHQRLTAILQSAKADTERKKSFGQLEAEEFKRQAALAEVQWNERDAKVALIGRWVDDREAEMLAMTRKSLETYFRDVHEDVRDQIVAYYGPDFKGFIETQIPVIIKKQCKMWVDSHGDALRSLIMRLSSELTGALTREFRVSIPLIEPRFVTSGMTVERIHIDPPEASKGRLHAGLILGGLSALLALSGFGLVMPMLSLAGYPWLSGHLEKAALEEAKQRFMPKFDAAFHLAAKNMRDGVLDYLDAEIRGLQVSAEVKYRQLLAAARNGAREETTVRDQPTAIVRSRLSVLDETLQRLRELEGRLSLLFPNPSKVGSR